MYKKEPWTLVKQEKNEKKKNTLEIVKNFFEKNKNKKYTLATLCSEVNRCKGIVSVAVSQLWEAKQIKIVAFKNNNGTLIALYQHISGNLPELNVVDSLSEIKGKRLTTVSDFIKRNKIKKEVEFRYAVTTSNIKAQIMKTNSNFCYCFREKDLNNLLKKEAATIKKSEKKKFYKKLKIFNWFITIEKE